LESGEVDEGILLPMEFEVGYDLLLQMDKDIL